MTTTDKMIELFDEFAEYFGLDDKDFPTDQPQKKQCEFEDKFNALICAERGHDIGPDQCGKPEHDYCCRCMRRKTDIEGGKK